MSKRILPVALIFFATSVAWWFLGATTYQRTGAFETRLRGRVCSLWGEPQEQVAPRICTSAGNIAPAASRIRARLDLEHRQKGLLWYSTYTVAFSGDYTFTNEAAEAQDTTFFLPLPSAKAVYDDLTVLIDGQPAPYTNNGSGISFKRRLEPSQVVRVRFGYRSLALDRWRYRFGNDIARVRDFELTAVTNFRDLDFENNTLPPSVKRLTPGGMETTWRFSNLLSGSQIAIAMPEKLQPGPLAGEISLFAPVSLLFFFFVMLMITGIRGIDLHPINFFFLACAFFAFHLLLAYLVDHIDVHAAFAIASLVSVFLVVSYLRLVVGIRFAAVEAGGAQFIYLVLFSYAFFFRGYTGLAITIGAILTLFAAMQLTASSRPGIAVPDGRSYDGSVPGGGLA